MLTSHAFPSHQELVEWVNASAIATAAIQAIVCDSSGFYVLFYWG